MPYQPCSKLVKRGNQEMYVSSYIRGQLLPQERTNGERKARKELELNLEHSYCLIPFTTAIIPLYTPSALL